MSWRSLPSRCRGCGCAAWLVLAVAVAFATGCATLAAPSGPNNVGGLGQQDTNLGLTYPQLIPVAPGPNWTAQQVVSGFLAASASFTDGHAVARQYLDPAVARRWNPSWALTVVGGRLQETQTALRSQALANGGSTLTSTIRVTGQPLSTLTNTGQPLPPSSNHQVSENFELARENGQWRITSLPAQLLLTRPAFLQVYQPRNLYFYSPAGQLVPDPVFVPQQATETALATDLVRALSLGGPPSGSWLYRSVQTDFPTRTTVLGMVRIDGALATVDLGGAAAHVGKSAVRRIAAQLVWTLTNRSYGPSHLQSVVLEINGRPQVIDGATDQFLRGYSGLVPTEPRHSELYFVGSDDRLHWAGRYRHTRPLPGDASGSRDGISAIAVSPVGSMLAGIGRAAQGCVIDTAPLGQQTAFTRHILRGSPCTSLSWDSDGDLWVAAGKVVWMLHPGAAPQRLKTGLPAGDSVRVFRVARDGARAVMIARSRSGSQLLLTSIQRSGPVPVLSMPVSVGTGIADPVSVSWYGPDYVVVLSGIGSRSQLTEVPLTGEPGTPITAPSGSVTSMTASGATITVAMQGTKSSFLLTSTGPDQPWRPAGIGRMPTYPG
jgi:spore germination protein GerM